MDKLTSISFNKTDDAPELEKSLNRPPFLTIVTPAYNEAKNLPLLHQRLRNVLDGLGMNWEWITVDDHSADETFHVLTLLAKEDSRLRGYRLSRNFGSHTAITCGLNHAQGNCAIVMAADLQDPPETIPDLVAEWQKGAQVVWAVRAQRQGEKATKLAFANLYYALMRRTGALKELSATGADFFLIDRSVIDAFNQFRERHVSILALITWMGFRQATISHNKEARLYGRSGWNLKKKLKLVLDSITSFTYFPIRLISYAGLITALIGFLYAMFVVFNALRGLQPQGWASLIVIVLILGGFQMVMLGVLGEYLWRALDESRHRPMYLIEAKIGSLTPTHDSRDVFE